ncbi:helix-turn-helix transcriptional regulator [Runella sp.]|uniref:helix-turn-helix domain-containing protein n=1 Tax=Runella sp. TaxID=1960881 RepID=UPI0030197DFD
MDIIERIIELRKKKGFTQSLMAEKLGIAPNNYGKIEKGITEMTVNRLNQIAEILSVSVIEILTGEQQAAQDSERVKELESRVDELENIVKLYWGNLYSSEREMERLRQYFTNAIYENIAEMSIQRGYSKLRFYHTNTDKTIMSLTITEFEKKYEEELKAIKSIKFRTLSNNDNHESTKTEETLNHFSLHTMSYIIANEVRSSDIGSEFVLIEEFKQKAVNLFFYKWLMEGSNLDLIDIVFGSGIIIDNTLLTTYNDAKSLEVEIMAEGSILTENLELIVG